MKLSEEELSYLLHKINTIEVFCFDLLSLSDAETETKKETLEKAQFELGQLSELLRGKLTIAEAKKVLFERGSSI
jgi:hypothetical protein